MAKNFDNVQTTRSVASAFNAAFEDDQDQSPKEPKTQKERDKENNVTRINLALENDNYNFARMMAMRNKKTITGYLNMVIKNLRKQMQSDDPELYEYFVKMFSDTK